MSHSDTEHVAGNTDHIAGDDGNHEAGIDVGKVVVVGVSSLVTFAVCTVAALLIMRQTDGSYAEAGGPPPESRPIAERSQEIGMVDQVTFDGDRRLDEWNAAVAWRRANYGWVDKSKGLVHIPVEKAMQQVVEQAAKGGATK